MVVVEQGRSMIGQEVAITVTSVLQTPAGRMIFGRVESRPQSVASGQAASSRRSIIVSARHAPLRRTRGEAAMRSGRLLGGLRAGFRRLGRRRRGAAGLRQQGQAHRLQGRRGNRRASAGARKEYQATLETLRAHYIGTGDIERARWAEEELVQFHRIPSTPSVSNSTCRRRRCRPTTTSPRPTSFIARQ